MFNVHVFLKNYFTEEFIRLTLKGEVSPNNNVDWVSRKQFYKTQQ